MKGATSAAPKGVLRRLWVAGRIGATADATDDLAIALAPADPFVVLAWPGPEGPPTG